MLPNADDLAGIVAERIMQRTLRGGTAPNINTLDSIAELEDMLKRTELSDTKITDITEALRKNLAKKEKQSARLSPRLEVDYLAENGGVRVTDLLDTDVINMSSRYADEMAGILALNRKGIGTRGDLNFLRDLAIQEDVTKTGGKNSKDIDELFDNTWAAFTGRAMGEGVDTNARRLLEAANLTLYDKLGLAQMLELGNVLGQAGIVNTLKAIPGMRAMRNRAIRGDDLLKENFIHITNASLAPFRHTRSSYRADVSKSGDIDHLTSLVDRGLAKATDMMNYLSLFNHATEFTRGLALRAWVGKITDLAEKRNPTKLVKELQFLGLTKQETLAIRDKILTTKPDKDADGKLSINTRDWDDPQLALKFETALLTAMDRSIQRGRVGEEMPALDSTVGAVLGHTKRYPLLAVNKQVLYNAGRNDTTALSTLMTTLSVPAIGYMAAEYVTSLTKSDPEAYREEKFSWNNIIYGALNYSANTPFLSDAANLVNGIGLLPDQLAPGEGKYARYGSLPVVSSIPVITVAEDWAKLLGTATDSDSDRSDYLKALKVVPGANLLGVTQARQFLED